MGRPIIPLHFLPFTRAPPYNSHIVELGFSEARVALTKVWWSLVYELHVDAVGTALEY